MPKFRKKPVVIEAIRMKRAFSVETLEGTMVGRAGDWLITGVAGEQYPCNDAIFRATYEGADAEALDLLAECKAEQAEQEEQDEKTD